MEVQQMCVKLPHSLLLPAITTTQRSTIDDCPYNSIRGGLVDMVCSLRRITLVGRYYNFIWFESKLNTIVPSPYPSLVATQMVSGWSSGSVVLSSKNNPPGGNTTSFDLSPYPN